MGSTMHFHWLHRRFRPAASEILASVQTSGERSVPKLEKDLAKNPWAGNFRGKDRNIRSVIHQRFRPADTGYSGQQNQQNQKLNNFCKETPIEVNPILLERGPTPRSGYRCEGTHQTMALIVGVVLPSARGGCGGQSGGRWKVEWPSLPDWRAGGKGRALTFSSVGHDGQSTY